MERDPNLTEAEAVHACFTELIEGRAEAARIRFGEPTFAEAQRLAREHDTLESAGTPDPGEPMEWTACALAPGCEFGGLQIGGFIGSGSTGEVYEARELSTGRLVAVKLLPPETSRAASERLHRETMVLATLEHPGIARLYRSGVRTDDAIPRRFMVMELVQGARTLSSWRSERPRSSGEIVRLMVTVCDAVAYAHGRGVIHCDLKPGNILVDADGRAVVIDFGIARILDADGNPAATVSMLGDRVAGTLAYIAPESLDARAAADVRADVHALGAILYELLAGRPFRTLEGLALPQRLAEIAAGDPPRLADGDRRLRGDLDRIVARAAARDPGARYASASQLGADLRAHLAGQPVLAELQSTRERLARGVVRHRQLVVAVTLAAALLVTTTVVSLRFARAAVREARLANLNAAARAIDDADLLIARQHLALLGAGDGSIERALIERAVALQGVVIDPGDWYDIAWGPDGEWFVANGHAGRDTMTSEPILRRFDRDAEGFKARWTIPAGESGIHGCAITHGGGAILDVDAKGNLRLIDAASGEIRTTVAPPRADANGLAVDVREDGLIALERGAAEFRALADPHTLIRSVDLGIGTPRALAFAGPRSDLVACAGDGGAVLVDARLGTLARRLETPASFQTAIRWNEEGTMLFVAGWDRTVRAYSPEQSAPTWTARGHRDSIWSVEMLDRDTLATAGADGTLRLWDARDGSPIAALPISDDVVWATSIDPSGTTLMVGSRLGLRAVALSRLRDWSGTGGHSSGIARARGVEAEPREDGSVALRSAGRASTTIAVPGSGPVDKVALSQDASLLAALRRDGTISVIALPGGNPLLSTREFACEDLHEPNGITGLALDAVHGRLFVASRRDGCASLEIQNGARAWTLQFGNQCTGVAIAPTGECAYISDRDGQLARVDAGDGSVVNSTRRQRTRVACLFVSEDGTRLIVGGADGSLRILEAESLAEQFSIDVSSSPMRSVRMTERGIETIDKAGVKRIR